MGNRGRGKRRRKRARRRGGTRRPFALLAGVLAVLAFGHSSRLEPTELVIDPALLTRLQTLAEGLRQEIVLCLSGPSRGDTAYARDFVMPVPRLSTPTRSSFDPCPRGTLASWHNHPRAGGSLILAGGRPRRVDQARAARRLCVLSETDIHTAARLRHPFVVVSVDAGTWCWWGLREVERFREASISPGPPAPDRLSQGVFDAAWARPAVSERAAEGSSP